MHIYVKLYTTSTSGSELGCSIWDWEVVGLLLAESQQLVNNYRDGLEGNSR